MAKTWYPTNFSGFYENEKFLYKLTGLAIAYTTKMCHYAGKIKQSWAKIDPQRWFLTKLWTKTWHLFMDCVTTRLQMAIGMFLFLFLTLKNARKFGKLAKFFLMVREPTKSLGKMTLTRSSEIQKFSQENVEFSLVVREPRQNLSKWSATRKRLRTAAL